MTTNNNNASAVQDCLATRGDEILKEECKPSELYSEITVTENPLGESVYDVYEKVEPIAEGSTCEMWAVKRKKKQTDDDNKKNDNNDRIRRKFISNEDSEKMYAMKIIDKNFIFGIFLKELRNEVEVLRTIDHPNVVRIYETYETRDYMYLILEYCEGGDLFSRDLPYSEHEAARILTQILSAIAHCHKHKAVHRDLKMENVLFQTKEKDSEVSLIDFGISQKYRRPREEYTMKHDVGTTYTISPQVIEGEYTEKTDVWSIGVIAYMLLSGKRPFDAKESKEIRPKIQQGDYNMDGPEWKNISREAKDFVSALLQYEPEDRPLAEEALQLPWLVKNDPAKEHAPPQKIMDSVQDALIHSVEEPKFKQLARMAIAHCAPIKKLDTLKRAFHALDESNDGTITLEEFQAALQPCELSNKELEKVFDDLDQSHTGVINYTEFLSATIETRGRIEDDLLLETFQMLDVNNCGFLSTEDLSQILEPSMTPEDLADKSSTVDDILKEVNAEVDGKMTYEHFKRLFRN